MATKIVENHKKSATLSINTNSLRWAKLIEQLIDNPEYDAVVRIMFFMAIGSLSTPPPRYIVDAVKERDNTTLHTWAENHAGYNPVSCFIRKAIFGKQWSIKTRDSVELSDLPTSFRAHDKVRCFVFNNGQTRHWLDTHTFVTKDVNYDDNDTGIYALGVVNGRFFYWYSDNTTSHYNDTSDNQYTLQKQLHSDVSTSWTGTLVNAVPVWRKGEPKVSGLYVCARFKDDDEDVIVRGRVADSHTKVVGGQETSRVEDNLYYFNADAGYGESKWQHVSGFFCNGVTHYLDFDVEYTGDPIDGSAGDA